MTPGPSGRVLGVDYGARRVGLALSDPLGMLAGGAGVWERTRDLAERLAALVRREGVVSIVVGLPLGPDGERGAKAREIGDFIRSLERLVTVPVQTWDESFSSVRAQELHREAGMKRKSRRQKGRVDEMAARLILQEFLDDRNARRP